jgi:F5/8 type C domain
MGLTLNSGFTIGPGVVLSSYAPSFIPTRSYRYWKFSVAKIRDGGAENNDNWQISEFVLKLQGQRIDYSTATASTTDGAVYSPGENPSNAIDNNPNTKYCEQPGTGGLSGLGWPLIVDFGKTVTADGMSYFTANDVSARDPSDWILWGSADGVNWDPVQWTQGYSAPSDRNTETQLFNFNPAFTHHYSAVPSTGGISGNNTYQAWLYPPDSNNQAVPVGAIAFGTNYNNHIGGIYTVTDNTLDTYQKITVVGDENSTVFGVTNVGSNEPFEIYWN